LLHGSRHTVRLMRFNDTQDHARKPLDSA